MTELLHDTEQEEYIMINLPRHVVQNIKEQYTEMKATEEDFDLTFWQFLVAEDYRDISPDRIDTVKPTEVQEV